MKTADIVKAWKDEDYRASLGPQQLAELPAHPAGDIELTAADCALVAGGGLKNTDIPFACNWTTSRVNICQ